MTTDHQSGASTSPVLSSLFCLQHSMTPSSHFPDHSCSYPAVDHLGPPVSANDSIPSSSWTAGVSVGASIVGAAQLHRSSALLSMIPRVSLCSSGSGNSSDSGSSGHFDRDHETEQVSAIVTLDEPSIDHHKPIPKCKWPVSDGSATEHTIIKPRASELIHSPRLDQPGSAWATLAYPRLYFCSAGSNRFFPTNIRA
jgi:hypothetical protein